MCVSTTGLRGSWTAGKALFLGIPMKMFPKRVKSVDWKERWALNMMGSPSA